ncbi:MAG: CoA transferase [Gammaproteobacteria bacterium]|nr:CoA transferase [Gammaproteobacteria bacterium]
MRSAHHNLHFIYSSGMQAFADIRVLDLTHVLAGPFCAYQLAVMGADVIKVEPPRSPDISRASGVSGGDGGMTSDFIAQNANKRAVGIDLKSPRGREALHRLVRGADVLIENYRSGALAGLELGYERAKELRADIIYCSISGFGANGPRAPRTAYDNVIQACSGLMASTGDANSAPLKTGPPVLDYGTGAQAAFAVAAALYRRSRDGAGQRIDVSMLDAALMLMASHITHMQIAGAPPPPSGNGSATHAGYGCYATADGLLMIGAYSGAQMKNLWEALGDPRRGAARAGLTPMEMDAHFAEDAPRIAEALRAKTAAQWEDELNRARVPAARVRGLAEALADPQLDGRAVLQRVPGESGGAKLPVAAFDCAEDGPKLTAPPPRRAQHTAEVLREAGYRDDELRELADCGAIQLAQPAQKSR